MRRRLRSNNTIILKLAMIGVVAMAGGFLLTSFLGSKSETQALSATEFQAGRIIDDSIFYNPNTMTAAEIDAFIDSRNPACDMWGTQKVYGNTTRADYVKQLRAQGNTKFHDPPFVCISEYYENPETHKTNFETGGKKEAGMLSAGEIIYEAAHEYNINPQVLLVMLKKESYVWGDDWPHKFQYNTVMGYACPDGAPCDTKYFGFYNQVMMAAWQLNYYREHIYSYNYRPYTTNQILYNPDRGCGSKSVYLENIATTSLYIYTPYTPNDGALANYPGTSYCGSYGNRNFYMYFREWFGSTLGVSLKDSRLDSGSYYITKENNFNLDWQPSSPNQVNGSLIVNTRTNSQTDGFSVSRNSDGTYTIKNANSGLVLGLASGTIESGARIQQQALSDSKYQKWLILDGEDGSFYIATPLNKSLVIGLNSETGELELQPITFNSSAQKIRFVTSSPLLPEGYYSLTSAANSNYTIDAEGASFKRGTNILLWSQNYGINQRFHFTYDATRGFYRIATIDDSTSLDVEDARKNNGTNVQLCTNNANYAQQWIITKGPNGSFHIRSALSGKMLDITGGAFKNGTNIETWEANGSAAQDWTIVARPNSSEVIEPGTYTIANQGSTPQFTQQIEAIYYSSLGYYKLKSPSTGMFLSADNSSSASFRPQSNTSDQLWSITTNKNNTFSIQSVKTLSFLTSQNSAFSLKSDSSSSNWFFKTPSTIEPENNSNNTTQAQNLTIIDTSRAYEIISPINQKYSLDVQWAKFTSGTNVWLYERNGTQAQKFYFKPADDKDTYEIVSSDNSYVLDVYGAINTNGTNIQLWRRNGGCNQKWTVTNNSDGTFSFFSKCSGKALDLRNAETYSENNILLWQSNGGKNQKWILK